MLVLVDGVDLTGKSTLVRKLAQRCVPPAFTQHNAGPPTTGDAFKEYLAPLQKCGHRLVIDRSYVSEMVWPVVFKRETTLGLDGFDYITDMVAELGGVHVHAFRDLEKLRRELIDAGEPSYHLDTASRLYEVHYQRIAERGGLVLPWDYETMDEGEDLVWMIDAAQDYWEERNG